MTNWNDMTKNQLRMWLNEKVAEYLRNGGTIKRV